MRIGMRCMQARSNILHRQTANRVRIGSTPDGPGHAALPDHRASTPLCAGAPTDAALHACHGQRPHGALQGARSRGAGRRARAWMTTAAARRRTQARRTRSMRSVAWMHSTALRAARASGSHPNPTACRPRRRFANRRTWQRPRINCGSRGGASGTGRARGWAGGRAGAGVPVDARGGVLQAPEHARTEEQLCAPNLELVGCHLKVREQVAARGHRRGAAACVPRPVRCQAARSCAAKGHAALPSCRPARAPALTGSRGAAQRRRAACSRQAQGVHAALATAAGHADTGSQMAGRITAQLLKQRPGRLSAFRAGLLLALIPSTTPRPLRRVSHGRTSEQTKMSRRRSQQGRRLPARTAQGKHSAPLPAPDKLRRGAGCCSTAAHLAPRVRAAPQSAPQTPAARQRIQLYSMLLARRSPASRLQPALAPDTPTKQAAAPGHAARPPGHARPHLVVVARGVAGARDARDLRHAAAAQLVQDERRVKALSGLLVVGLYAPHKVQLRPTRARRSSAPCAGQL